MGAINDTLNAYGQVFKLADKFKLYGFLYISGIISLFIGLGILYAALIFSDDISVFILEAWKWEWGKNTIAKILPWITGFLLFVCGIFVYRYLVAIALSPVMSPLSEKLENGLSGKDDSMKLSVSRMLIEFVRGIGITIRNLIREMVYIILLLLLSFVPFFTWMTTPAIIMVQSYYAGFGSMDYCLERHFSIRQSVDFIRKNRLLTTSHGAIFLLILMIPVAGLVLAPWMSTIAGTQLVFNKMKTSYSQ